MQVSITDVNKSFGKNHVLKSINLKASSGKALGLLGRNGAGKTTTIRILMGVFPADSGSVLVDGEKINRHKVTIGYLPEERGLYPKKVIIEQLVFFARLKGMSKKDAVKSADYWLDRLDMKQYKNKKLDTLSKGNQQKIQLVATLIANPEIVILDEPFSGLDPVNAMLLKDVVKELIAKNKVVIFSSHQMNYIEEFCNDVAIINGGEVVLSGSISEIKRSYDRSKMLVVAQKEELEKIKNFLDEETTIIKEDTLLVKMKSASDKNMLIKRLADEDFDIDEIKVYEPSLNDIFVEYTEDKV